MLGNIVKKVVKKVKAAVPKVVNAAKRKVKKVVKHVAKKVVPRVVKTIPKVVNAAKNKTKKVISKVAKSVPRVVNAAKAKINKAAKATTKKIQKVVKKTAQGVKQKVQQELKEISQKNERIVNKVKAAWQQTASGIKRGTVTIGAMGFNNSNSFKMLDFVLQARRAVVEEYPILDFPGTGQLKDVANIVKTGMEGIAKGSQSAGKFIYDKKIPGVSDFVGALTDVRPENAESNIFTVAGAFTKGVVADGLGGTIEGIVDLAADPAAAIEGVTKILAYPEETLPAICEGVKEFWDKKIVNGSPEDHANLVGQAAFEIASWFVGAGEAKTAANTGKVADKLADTAKAVDKITDVARAGDKLADTAKVTDKITDVAKTADKAADLSKVTSKAKLLDKLPSATALKSAGKNLVKNLDDMANKATKKLGKIADNAAGKATSQLKNLALKKNELVTKVSDKLGDMAMEGGKKLGDTIDQMRHIMNQLTPQPTLAMAGVGELDDIGRTGDKIQDIIKRTLKIDKSEAGSGVKISGAVKEEVIEDIKAVEEKASRALDDVAEGAADAVESNYVLFNKTHKGAAPVPKGTGPNGGYLQSHHGLQQQWAKENLSKYGYDPDLAPTVTIETGKGMPHTSISIAQNARRNARVASGKGKWSSSLQEELQYIVDDFTNAGFSKDTINSVLEQQYKMLDKLKVPYERIDIR